jgi:hypothetical protein
MAEHQAHHVPPQHQVDRRGVEQADEDRHPNVTSTPPDVIQFHHHEQHGSHDHQVDADVEQQRRAQLADTRKRGFQPHSGQQRPSDQRPHDRGDQGADETAPDECPWIHADGARRIGGPLGQLHQHDGASAKKTTDETPPGSLCPRSRIHTDSAISSGARNRVAVRKMRLSLTTPSFSQPPAAAMHSARRRPPR